ncbi:hypothetical protein BDA99DRAFT_543999 [Phascolomyces articulosus]|uniref:Uncharacterized protein n=1 Tax=Phascolomyces articulosus TaxID=60185 RepID=A0AAD5JVW6_9FUNG|nr:hypothetical protein BDA99DRAFT_543999 [Phascolomyces articulosus]
MTGNDKVKYIMKLDLTLFESIKTSLTQYKALDILINNSGVVLYPYHLSQDVNIEVHFVTNHVRHYNFTMLQLPFMIQSDQKQPCRIVNVISKGHLYTSIATHMVPYEVYGYVNAYSKSKKKATDLWDFTEKLLKNKVPDAYQGAPI